MPYDPDVPATNAEATSAMFRGQFQGLKTLIDAVSSVTGAVMDSVTTLPSGSLATVEVIFDGMNVRFTFGIPRGSDGATGATGQNGEVTQVDLNNALQSTLAQTSGNSNGVSTLDNPFTNDPPTMADMELMRQAYNDLVLALRRP